MNTKIAIFMLIISLHFISAATEIYGQNKQARINIAKENLRAVPDGKKIGELTSDTQILILEEKGDWVKIAATGWMWKKSITVLKDQRLYIQASHILVKTKEEAARILKQLMDGVEFSELAKKHSLDKATSVNGGDLGIIAQGDLFPAIDEAAFKLNPSQISGIVKSALGYHIIKRTK